MKKILLDGIIPVNCYLIIKGDSCIIIDPGSDLEKIKQSIGNLKVEKILLTHGHVDHIDEIGFFNVPIYIHEDDYILLNNPDLACYNLLEIKPKYIFNKLNVIKTKDQEIINFKDETIKVIHTPGHTLGSVCYLHNNDLYSGDTLFYNGIGRTDLAHSSSNLMKKSIVKLIDALDDKINVYPGHDENTNIKNERKNNVYYQYYKKVIK